MTVCNSLGRSSVVSGIVTQMLCYLSYLEKRNNIDKRLKYILFIFIKLSSAIAEEVV